MKRESSFKRTLFPAHVVREAFETLFPKESIEQGVQHFLSLQLSKDRWTYDSFEQFLADYPRQAGYAYADLHDKERQLVISIHNNDTGIQVKASTHGPINATFAVFERKADAFKLPPPPEPLKPVKPPPIVFVGHGRSALWRDLKDHLAEKHGYRVEAYEVGARAGHTIRDILADILGKSSFACLVLTAEDEMADGTMRARQNVIHETGLFQGRLGFSRAIVLLEEGAEEFSNIHGIQQIRFAKGNIKETFGEVLATLRREFGPAKPS
jgi:Predicted nucleotide-binding protein containing TIR-like domain